MRVILDVDEFKLEELDDLAGYGFVLDPRYGLQLRREEPFTLRCVGDFPDDPPVDLESLPRAFPCVIRAKPLLDGRDPGEYWLKCKPGKEMSVMRALSALGAAMLGYELKKDDGDTEFRFRYAGPIDAVDDIEGVKDAVLVPPNGRGTFSA